MTWMAKWVGGHPVYAASAHGARIEDVDGNVYVDFSLGDTAAMAGHSPPATVAAVQRRLGEQGGATLMLPTEDAAWVGEELTRRFGVARWSFALTATDANRWALRLCREVTQRPYVLVFNYCYHGSVDETFVTLDGARPRSREGNVGPAVDPTQTTRVCEFNDLGAVERLLDDGQVACVLAEPALTNIGIVLPEPGFHDGLRAACERTGTLLIIDETHTISAGPGGCTAAWGLSPDVVTIGKAIAGGIPIGAYGLSAELAARIEALDAADLVDVGGVGGTLAGNALSLAAARATLGEVLTADGLRGDDGAVRPLRRRRAQRPRRARGAVVDRAARGPRRAGLHARPAAQRRRERGAARRRARGRAAPLPAQSRRHDHAVSQHGADVAGDDRGRRRPPHRGLRRGRRSARLSRRPCGWP